MNLLRHVLISVCCGVPDRPCGVLLGMRTVAPESSGISHGLCPSCEVKMRRAFGLPACA